MWPIDLESSVERADIVQLLDLGSVLKKIEYTLLVMRLFFTR